ncbi:MAG: hypothetical protein COT85_07890 [Chlamydiae bacterium CG10_big_fil_rev_8_21_14_0_10_42_34]|nr:MAG: hypothetical protein COT85_07890 [Chlamydiae bacterium CG10_big_fil_rev_8_21_14_0_10_42_34]
MKSASPPSPVFEKGINFPASLTDENKNHSLSDLLPYDAHKKVQGHLTNGLKEYKMLLVSARDTITEFLSGNLASFDSLVGENACQIRATLLALISKYFPIEGDLLLKSILDQIKKIESIKEIPDSKQTLGSYLRENSLELPINTKELFLIASHILTKVRVLLPPDAEKKIVRNENTNTKKIKTISPVSSTFSRELVKKLRSLVSRASVQFVQDIADILPIPEPIADMVSETYSLEHNKFGRLKCLPCFWYTLILLEYSIKFDIPIILKVKQIATDRNHEVLKELPFYFKVVQNQYQAVDLCELSPKEPALVIFASCCRKADEFPVLDQWKDEILKFNPREMILAYAAAHRQYPDEDNDKVVSKANCELYHHYKEKANEWGCSLNNPRLFFLVHAYCDKVGNVQA